MAESINSDIDNLLGVIKLWKIVPDGGYTVRAYPRSQSSTTATVTCSLHYSCCMWLRTGHKIHVAVFIDKDGCFNLYLFPSLRTLLGQYDWCGKEGAGMGDGLHTRGPVWNEIQVSQHTPHLLPHIKLGYAPTLVSVVTHMHPYLHSHAESCSLTILGLRYQLSFLSWALSGCWLQTLSMECLWTSVPVSPKTLRMM